MKINTSKRLSLLLLLLGSQVPYSATTEAKAAEAKVQFEKTDTLIQESDADKDARMEWWRDARFGMFIHWGIYSVPAGMYNGKSSGGLAEWIMRMEKIPVNEYEKYARAFNPTEYDPEAWVKAAKDAGMKYIVITSKHHDGFSLWDSKVSDYDVVDATPYGKDLLKPLAEACKKHGIHFGIYYSILDWHHPFANRESYLKKGPNPTKDWDRYRDEAMIPQLEELLSGEYGDVGILWFDGEWIDDWTEPQGKGLYNLLRKMKPDLIINNRVGKGRKGMEGMNKGEGYAGDFGTPEKQIPDRGITDVDWETCMTMNNTWGYRKSDDDWKSAERMIRQLVDTSSKGGNFLLNIGPTAEGAIPEPSLERLAAIGDWMDVNAESIYGSGPSPYNIPKWGRYTSKPGKIYAHVFDWPKNKELNIADPSLQVEKAYFLADAEEKPLEIEKKKKGWTIHLPETPLDSSVTVITLEIGE